MPLPLSKPLKNPTAQLLFTSARGMRLNPKWLTKNLFSVTTDDGIKHVWSSRSSLNSHLSVSLTNNKYLMRTILDEAQLPNIPYLHATTLAQAAAFLANHRKIIVKPVKGARADDIHLVDQPAQMAKLEIKKYILEKYIEGKELRYLTLEGKVIAACQNDYTNPLELYRNLNCSAYAAAEWDPQLVALSEQIVKLIDLRFGAVDYLITADGTVYVLELNSAPALKPFHSPDSGPATDVAQLFLQAMVDDQTPAPIAV